VQKGSAGAEGNSPLILIISPPPMRKLLPEDELSWIGAHDKLSQLQALYRKIATRYGCHFLDAGEILSTDDMGKNGFHLAVSGHAKLGEKVSKKVKEIFA
jgi:lysophospholipase L1-like esterase